jgi:hypothetical protein
MEWALAEIAGGRIHILWSDFWSLADCMQEAAEQAYIADGMATFVCSFSTMI